MDTLSPEEKSKLENMMENINKEEKE